MTIERAFLRARRRVGEELFLRQMATRRLIFFGDGPAVSFCSPELESVLLALEGRVFDA